MLRKWLSLIGMYFSISAVLIIALSTDQPHAAAPSNSTPQVEFNNLSSEWEADQYSKKLVTEYLAQHPNRDSGYVVTHISPDGTIPKPLERVLLVLNANAIPVTIEVLGENDLNDYVETATREAQELIQLTYKNDPKSKEAAEALWKIQSFKEKAKFLLVDRLFGTVDGFTWWFQYKIEKSQTVKTHERTAAAFLGLSAAFQISVSFYKHDKKEYSESHWEWAAVALSLWVAYCQLNGTEFSLMMNQGKAVRAIPKYEWGAYWSALREKDFEKVKKMRSESFYEVTTAYRSVWLQTLARNIVGTSLVLQGAFMSTDSPSTFLVAFTLAGLAASFENGSLSVLASSWMNKIINERVSEKEIENFALMEKKSPKNIWARFSWEFIYHLSRNAAFVGRQTAGYLLGAFALTGTVYTYDQLRFYLKSTAKKYRNSILNPEQGQVCQTFLKPVKGPNPQ